MADHLRSRVISAIATDLTTLPDIGAVSVRWLREIGINTVADLQRVGPAEAYGRVAYRFGSAVNRNFLYALAMGLQGRKYNSATQHEKRQLCEQAGIEFRPTRKRPAKRSSLRGSAEFNRRGRR
jgi:hypothetical protein